MSKLRAIWRQSLAEFLIYRGTGLITFLLALLFLVIELVTGAVYFGGGRHLSGWTRNDYFILITFVNAATYLYNIFFILGHQQLSEDILTGGLDYLLVRPVSSFWLVAGREMDFPSIFNFAITLGLLLVFLIKQKVALWQTGLLLSLIVVTAFFIFLLNQICLTLLFWFNGLTALGGVIEDLISYATRPQQIFPRLIQNFFVFIIPVLLATNLSVNVLKNHFAWQLIYYLAFLGLLFWLARWLWRKGLANYASAN